MPEREVPQSVRDAQQAEAIAEDFFAATEGTAVIGYFAGAFISIVKGAPELAPAFIVGAVGIYKLSERMYAHYHQRKDMKTSQLPEPEPTLAEQLSRI